MLVEAIQDEAARPPMLVEAVQAEAARSPVLEEVILERLPMLDETEPLYGRTMSPNFLRFQSSVRLLQVRLG